MKMRFEMKKEFFSSRKLTSRIMRLREQLEATKNGIVSKRARLEGECKEKELRFPCEPGQVRLVQNLCADFFSCKVPVLIVRDLSDTWVGFLFIKVPLYNMLIQLNWRLSMLHVLFTGKV